MIALLNAAMTKILSRLTVRKVAQSVGQSDGKSSGKASVKFSAKTSAKSKEWQGVSSLQQGFTLLEVMVALAILSVASAGLITATGGYLKQSQKVEDKVIAAWVADNWLNELRLAETAPDSEEVKAEANMAGREWLLSAQVIDTASVHLKRVEIEVRRADDGDKGAVLSQLTAFLRSER